MSDFEIAAYDRNDCLLCRKDGNVVGQVNVRDLRDESFGGYVIWNLLVFPEHRNLGVGEALIQCVIENFDDAPVLITAEPFYDTQGLDKANLLQWYQRLGFEEWLEKPDDVDGARSAGCWMIREPWKKNEPTEI